MIQIRHHYEDVAYYLQRDYPVYVKDVRGRYLPMVIYGLRVDKRDGKLKLRVQGARSKWLKAKNHHVIYTDATEGPATRNEYNPNEESRRSISGVRSFTGMSSMNVSGSFITMGEPVRLEPLEPMRVEIPEVPQITEEDVRESFTMSESTGNAGRININNTEANFPQAYIETIAERICDGETSVARSELTRRARRHNTDEQAIERIVAHAIQLLAERQLTLNRAQSDELNLVEERTRGLSNANRVNFIARHILDTNRGNLTTNRIQDLAGRYARTFTELGLIVDEIQRVRMQRVAEENLRNSLSSPSETIRPIQPEPRRVRDDGDFPF